ncbi:MAG TPA: tRNA uridine-5-carboxymethylaminomethyl(34) synthesis GTPase MnmE [Bdellovibrionota bacterium]|nr:tRNA uridine-5-carboxymethylaminomethyl(34) synthesis GTPase MnmE [Bdellovibrionota bacterium]
MEGYLSESTIAAVATALGGPIAIVRVSGPGARRALGALAGPGAEGFTPRKLHRARLKARDGRALDDALVVLFAAPDSFTGEDVVELHLHGGGYGVATVMEELQAIGARQALPGEFSFRAVRNGKMTLDQAYATADLIAASNGRAASLALEKLSGSQGCLLSRVAEELRQLATLGEAGIDFSDQDIDEVSIARLSKRIGSVMSELDRLAASYERGRRIQEGVDVALVGPPNAGKSSFFNALLGEDRSIVSAMPGTTRDVVGERLTLNGETSSVTMKLVDTAGLRKTGNDVERMGIERTLAAAGSADLVVFLADSSESPGPAREQWTCLLERVPSLAEKTIGILTKTDLAPKLPEAPFPLRRWVPTSAVTGSGIPEAVRAITQACETWVRREAGEILLTRPEQLKATRTAIEHLGRARAASAHELFAADVRQALHALGPLVGETLPDDILGRIFSDFCIGK